MMVTLQRGRSRVGGARLLSAGVLACGVVLLPASSAFAQDMPAMKDGMMCPHAVGDASNPATAAPPTRSAPNEAPLGAKPVSVVTSPAPGSASRPATKPVAQRASAGESASTPAATSVRSTTAPPATVRVVQPQRAVAPVARPQQASAPVVRRAVRAAPKHRVTPTHLTTARPVSTAAVTSPVIPDVTRPSAGHAPVLVATDAGRDVTVSMWLAIGGAALMLAFAAAFVLHRRRGLGGALAPVKADGPLEPSVLPVAAIAFDEVEIALHEMIAEARARELYGDVAEDMDVVETELAAR